MHSGTIGNHTPNPFSQTIQSHQPNLIDLQNQLTITNKVKCSLEAEVISLKKTLIQSKDKFAEELQAASDQLLTLQQRLKRFESDHPITLTENKSLKKQLDQLRNQHKSLAKGATDELDGKKKDRSALAKN